MRTIRNLTLALSILSWTFTSCTTTSRSHPSGEPEEVQAPSAPGQEHLETIAILGTNDIHGSIVPEKRQSKEASGAPSVEYRVGGLSYLASYVKVLRAEFGDRLIWLDGGDEYQGSIESNLNKGAAMVKFFNQAGLTAAAIGNHEFDFGPEPTGNIDVRSALKNRMREARFPYLAANIVEKASGRPAAFPHSFPRRIFQAGKLKVGVIGLSTLDTPTTTRPEYVADLHFSPLKDATLREAKALRTEGADIVVITAHAGLFCSPGKVPLGHAIRKPTDLQGDCKDQEEMVQLLKSLPSGTVDAVVAGHTHQVIHHWIAGVPVIEAGAYNRYFNLIYLTYDWKQKKLLTDLTRIEGPVPVCPEVFQNQNDCNGDRPAPREGRGPLVTTKFHRQKITEDHETTRLLEPYIEKAAEAKKEVWGQAARTLEHERYKESALGGLIADAIRKEAKADTALVNSGGIRQPIEAGPITYGAIFRTLPFDNTVVRLNLTGRELKTLLMIAESGSRGFPPVSGLRLRLKDINDEAPHKDLNGNGKAEAWETDRLIEVRLENGEKVQDKKMYTLATLDFLVSGGDDLGWFMTQIPESRRYNTGVIMRDAVAKHIRELTQKQGPINSVDRPLLDAASPRMVFEKLKTKKGGKRKKKKRSKTA